MSVAFIFVGFCFWLLCVEKERKEKKQQTLLSFLPSHFIS
jgi:hypothetical protein